MQNYEDNGPLPRDWRLLPLGEVARTQSCNSKLIKGRLPSEPAKDLFPAFSASGQDVWCATAEHKGDAVIISAVGARCGKCFFASGEWSAIANTHILWPKPDVVDVRFLWRLVNDEKFWIRGQSAQPFVQVGATKEKRVVVPPLNEQRKIAGVLDFVQRAMDQQEQLLALTAELKRALLQQLFTHGLRHEPQKETEIGPIPQSWEVVELASVVDQIDYGFSAPIPKTPPENGVKIVSTADITKDGHLLYGQIRSITAPEKTVGRLTLQTGDVLFNWRNSAELIGKTAVFEQQSEPHIFASFILRIKCGETRSHNFFLAHLMNHWREEGVFVKLARRAVNQANYNRNEISVLKIPLPTYAEQREIAVTIGALEQSSPFTVASTTR